LLVSIGESARSFCKKLESVGNLASDPDPSVRLASPLPFPDRSSSLTIDTDINTNATCRKNFAALVNSSSDAKDPLLPYMIWLAANRFSHAIRTGAQVAGRARSPLKPLAKIDLKSVFSAISRTGEPVLDALDFRRQKTLLNRG